MSSEKLPCTHDLYRKYNHLPSIRVCRKCGDHFSIRRNVLPGRDNPVFDKERERAVHAVMDLYFALRDIDGNPTKRDLVTLAKRIRHG